MSDRLDVPLHFQRLKFCDTKISFKCIICELFLLLNSPNLGELDILEVVKVRDIFTSISSLYVKASPGLNSCGKLFVFDM